MPPGLQQQPVNLHLHLNKTKCHISSKEKAEPNFIVTRIQIHFMQEHSGT